MTQTFYITTPIYYVNDSPHIGHAYTTLAYSHGMSRMERVSGNRVLSYAVNQGVTCHPMLK